MQFIKLPRKLPNPGKLLGNWQKQTLVILLIMTLLVPTILTIPAQAYPGWYWCRPITINSSQVEGDLDNFPVLISLSGDWLNTMPSGHVGQIDGGDIVFTDAGNTTKLDHEIENYNGETGNLVAWVKIPFLSSTTDTIIQMRYGNETCENQWNTAAVWDDHFKMVQHLQEKVIDEGAATNAHLDSTANSNHGNQHGNNDASGKIDKGQYFNTSLLTDDYITCGYDQSLDFKGVGNSFTIEAWINTYSEASNGGIVGRWDNYSRGYQYVLKFRDNFDRIKFQIFDIYDSDIETAESEMFSIQRNHWYHVVGVADAGTLQVYLNGNPSGYTDTYGTIADIGTDIGLDIGISKRGTYVEEEFNGTIDEVRISDIARDGAWIKTSYNNQCNNQGAPSKFYCLGDEIVVTEDVIPAPVLPTIALLGIGLAGLVGWFGMGRHRKRIF